MFGEKKECVFPSISNLIAHHCNGKFPFESNYLLHNSIIDLSGMMALFTFKNGGLNEFCNRLEAILADFNTDTTPQNFAVKLIPFVLELTGIFVQAYSEMFSFFFNWSLSKCLNTFVECIPLCLQMTDKYALHTILKFFEAFFYEAPPEPQYNKEAEKLPEPVMRTPRKIKVQTHSANGIQLFKAIASAIIPIFANVIEPIPDDSPEVMSNAHDLKLGHLKHALRLAGFLLSADFVMFGAFALYEDPILNNLIAGAISALGSINLKSEIQIKSFSYEVINFLSSLTNELQHHLGIVLSINPDFFISLPEIFCHLLKATPSKSIVILKAANGLIKYLQSNIETDGIPALIEKMAEKIVLIYLTSWELWINNTNSELTWPTIQLIWNILKLNPSLIHVAKDSIRPQIPETSLDEYDQIMQNLIEAVENIASHSDPNGHLLTQIRNFAANRESKIKISIQLVRT